MLIPKKKKLWLESYCVFWWVVVQTELVLLIHIMFPDIME